MTQKLANTPKTKEIDISKIHFIQWETPSWLADKFGVFLSAFEAYFWKETSKFGQLRSDDVFAVTKKWEDGGISIARKRGGKLDTAKIEATDIFQDTYTPTPLLPELKLLRKPNGKYDFGGYEVSTTNMDTLRNEVQRVAIILTQMCMTRGKLQDLSSVCEIQDSWEERKKWVPVFELTSNPYKDSDFREMVPSFFWKSQNLHFENFLPILKNPALKKAKPTEVFETLKTLFEEMLTKELQKT